MSDYAELKSQARQRKSELEHFGTPGNFGINPSVLLELIADAERLEWLNKQYEVVTANHNYSQPEGEVVAYRWTIEEPCGDVRSAIDMMATNLQPLNSTQDVATAPTAENWQCTRTNIAFSRSASVAPDRGELICIGNQDWTSARCADLTACTISTAWAAACANLMLMVVIRSLENE